MKYILLMSGTNAGVNTYHAWSPKDIEAHMRVEGVSVGLLDRRCCHSRTRLRDRGTDFGSAGTRRSVHEHADRSPAVRDFDQSKPQ